MSVVCPGCGQTSRDPEFCDFCNGDLNGKPTARAVPDVCPAVAGGLVFTPEQQAVFARPEGSLLVQSGDSWQRVHWIDSQVMPLWSARIRQRLEFKSLTCLPPVQLLEVPGGCWMIAEAEKSDYRPWALPLENPQAECERLLRVMHLLAESLEELHGEGLVWLSFDPTQLELWADSAGREHLRFTDLDVGVYPASQCPERLHLKTSFAATEIVRCHPEDIGPRTDVFHLSMFGYFWLAGLLPDGFPGEGLEAINYQIPKLRIYAPKVPPGVAKVLARGMAVKPSNRFATPSELMAALEAATLANRQRLEFTGKIAWEIGAHTLTGRTKTALEKGNEDRVLVLPLSNPPRALVAVADGITTCDIGSGALASLIVTIVLENTFDAGSVRENFPERIAAACDQGARTLLAWAIEQGYLEQLEEGADLMGTTLTAGWLEGNTLSLANLGDSRAYLIHAAGVEQLTVDGDLASGMLAGGMAPEAIRDLGPVSKALRECIGGCTFDAAGEVTILEECCNPPVTEWRLVPGDVVVLCSDGLVEEGAFLEPEVLANMVRAHPHLSAPELARHLCQAADEIQRLPSPLEPDGFGDNVSCIVIRIAPEG